MVFGIPGIGVDFTAPGKTKTGFFGQFNRICLVDITIACLRILFNIRITTMFDQSEYSTRF